MRGKQNLPILSFFTLSIVFALFYFNVK